MARLLRLLPDPTCTHEPGGVDPPEITLLSLAAMGERTQSLQRTAPSWRNKVRSGGCSRFADGLLAYVRTPGGPGGPAQPLLRFTQSSPTLCSDFGLTRSNRRGTRPVCPVVWEGWRREAPPYPDQYAYCEAGIFATRHHDYSAVRTPPRVRPHHRPLMTGGPLWVDCRCSH